MQSNSGQIWTNYGKSSRLERSATSLTGHTCPGLFYRTYYKTRNLLFFIMIHLSQQLVKSQGGKFDVDKVNFKAVSSNGQQ